MAAFARSNRLMIGDNLQFLRDYIQTESVDLIYLDPPLASASSPEVALWEVPSLPPEPDPVTLNDPALRALLDIAPIQARFWLYMLAARIVECRRVLRNTGSLYFQVDPPRSHLARLLLDTVFGADAFRREIVWRRSAPRRVQLTVSHDNILLYTKSSAYTWNAEHAAADDAARILRYRHSDLDGRRFLLTDLANHTGARPNLRFTWNGYSPPPLGWRFSKDALDKLDSEGRIFHSRSRAGLPRLKRYLDEAPATTVSDVWTDIDAHLQPREYLEYPAQKPLALLARLIATSSNPSDVFLDPFCGTGTSIEAAEELGRQWIAIDSSHAAIALLRWRLQNAFGNRVQYELLSEIDSTSQYSALLTKSGTDFENWAMSMIGARPLSTLADQDVDVDGVIPFLDDGDIVRNVIVTVKRRAAQIDDVSVMEALLSKYSASIGIIIVTEQPSAATLQKANEAGEYRSPLWNAAYPRIQIIAADDLTSGRRPAFPTPGSGVHDSSALPTMQTLEGDDD